MTRMKHVLILTILILPMFALVPVLVTGPTGVLANEAVFDTSVPATSVQKNFRVAVYVEDDTTLPLYAEGGEYTAYYANVIQFLEAEGFIVTPVTTQDILDNELIVARFDAFVLPNQLPKDDIVNHVKDYWLAGGGILSIGNSLGYLLYMGMIHPSLEGDFGWVLVGPPDYYVYQVPYGNVSIKERHPVTKSFEVDDLIPYTDNTTVWNWLGLSAMIGESFHFLAADDGVTENGAIFALDNPNRGGKIVQIPGNCSAIPSWQHSIITNAIDWLAPRPKGRILVDLTHDPLITVDSWDEGGSAEYAAWRDTMVNHSFIVDKLHPSSAGNLTAANLNSYDMLFIPMPRINFTSSEVAAVTGWVNAGGGLFCLGDRWIGSLAEYDQNLNYLLMNFDVSIFPTGDVGDPINFYDMHPTTESCTPFYDNIYGLVNFTGDATGVWRTDEVNYVSAADTHGSGRIILFADINWMAEIYLGDNSHYQYAINVANWLTAATADVLLHVYNLGLTDPWDAPAIDALNDLGISYYLTSSVNYMNLSLHSQQWSLVIIDQAWPGLGPYLGELSSFLDTGGNLLVSWYRVDTFDSDPLWAKIGFEISEDFPDKAPFHIWDTGHEIFNYPNNYGVLNYTPAVDFGDEGDLLTVYPNATALAGYTETDQPGNATTVLGFGGHALFNAYLLDQLSGDLDDSTYSDALELWENQIAFMYYDRPTIDSPADVTYMETETGNDIVWTPTADAGPWEYVFSVNGTPVEGGRWDGSALTFNVDGVNVSITEYELTVFDRLGYGVSDLVTLNVTEYVPPTGPGIDPTLFIIIGAVVAGVVIILVVVMQRKKKK